jgi:type IV pilus assembly protein PilN
MIRVNLLKAERKDVDDRSTAAEDENKKTKAGKDKSAKAAKKTPTGNLILVLILVLVGALAVLQSQSLSRERNLLSVAQDEAARLQPVVDKLDAIEWQKLYLEKKVELIRTLRAQQGVAVGILDAVAKDIPDWVWLTELVLNKTGVLIKGKALSLVLISDFVRNLEQAGPFAALSIINTQQRNEGQNAFIEFTLMAALPPPVMPAAGTVKPSPNVPAQGAGTIAPNTPQAGVDGTAKPGSAKPAPNVPAQGAGTLGTPKRAPGAQR